MPPSSTPHAFPERLRAARDRRGLSQADLAAKTGLQPSAVSHFETGRRAPSFDNLRRLADALNVTTDYLLGRVKEPTAVGPVSDQLFRDAEKLSESDLDAISKVIRALAQKGDQKRRDEK